MLTDKNQRFTPMAAAFYLATIENPKSRVCKRVGRAIERQAGLVEERAVDAKVSFRTAQKLKQEGVL